MAKVKRPKPPLFKYQHSIVWKTYFKDQPCKGEGTKKRQNEIIAELHARAKRARGRSPIAK